MKIEGKEYRTIWLEGNIVKIIDQTKASSSNLLLKILRQ